MIASSRASEILAKLEVLYHCLYSEGEFLRADIVCEAEIEIKKLKRYEQMREVRIPALSNRPLQEGKECARFGAKK